MAKTIIHVGLHKTASTYLQLQIFSQAKSKTFLSRPYTQHNRAFNQLQFADDTLYEKERIQRELETFPSENLLLSDETFSGCPLAFHYVNRSMIARRLADLFPDAEIILFLRDQRDFCTSHYSSYIKMPYGFNAFEDFLHIPDESYDYDDFRHAQDPASLNSLHYNTNDFCLSLDGLQYTRLIDLYADLFPQCHVFLFEEMVARPQETVERLSAICEEDFVYRKATENPSLTPGDLVRIQRRNVIKRIRSKFVRESLRAVYRLAPVLKTEDIKAKSSELIGNYFTEDNENLKAKLPSIDWSRYKGKYV